MSELKPFDEFMDALVNCDTVKVILTGCGESTFETKPIHEGICALANRRSQPANEPLTLEDGFDITNADGTPVDYNALGQKYKDQLCYCDIDQFYIGEDGELVLMDDCGKAVSVDRGDYHIEARPPERSEHDA